VRRLLLLLLCVALFASIAIAAHAAVLNVKVENVTTFACNAPIVSSTTTVTTAPSGGCQTSVVCPGIPDNQNHNNDNTCDGNNGGGNG
jgi:hypothetical protein